MKVLLTGGSGDLGQVLCPELVSSGHEPVVLDVVRPANVVGEFVEGSILDRSLLERTIASVDFIVHIAAWHGIHEFRKDKDAFDFWDLNVTGTMNILEYSARNHKSRLVFISSTSVDDWPGMYAHSKILCEDLMRTYSVRHDMDIISLRARAFIPHWNRSVYNTIGEWACWYWKGSIHIGDVAQAVIKSIDALVSDKVHGHTVLTLDGACEFQSSDLDYWDQHGPGSTFKRVFGEDKHSLAVSNGLNPAAKPKIIGYADAQTTIGYVPTYGFRHMLEELAARNDV